MYSLRISAKGVKELKEISIAHRKAIIFALKDIKEDPLLGKPLTRELTGLYSFRVGVYRIIYKINKKDHVISILTAGHRSTIYG